MKVNDRYKQKYHANVPSGWANDPNGMIYHDGKIHFFFQHYPYDSRWGTMHWGHFTSDDFIKWEEQPIALRPDQDYEVICGCCSGNTIEKDGKLYLMYTAAQPERQRQCMAVSLDGIHFTKYDNNPILTAEMLSPEVSTRDFRDPKIFRKNGWYYCLAGARIIDPAKADKIAEVTYGNPSDERRPHDNQVHHVLENPSDLAVLGGDMDLLGYGNMILFRSKDLDHWEYLGRLIYRQPGFDEEYFKLDGVYECPDYFESNGQEIVLASPQRLPKMGNMYENQHSVVWIAGEMDFETGRFHMSHIQEMDAGFDFYAAQSMAMPDGRQVMMAWKEMWDRDFPSREDNWAGTYTFPRELTWKNGWLYQWPVRELEAYRKNKAATGGIVLHQGAISVEGISGDVIELDVELQLQGAKKAGLKVFAGQEHETLIYYDCDKKAVIFDRTHAGIHLSGVEENTDIRTCDIEEEDTLRLHVLLDRYSVEVFINDGRYTMTGNVYPDPEDTDVEIFCEGGSCAVLSAVKYDICVE